MLRHQDEVGLSRLYRKVKKWLRSYNLRQLLKTKSSLLCRSWLYLPQTPYPI